MHTSEKTPFLPKRRTSERSIAMLDKILQAILSIGSVSGFGNVSIDAIAKYSELSKGGLLYHFPTKKALLQELLRITLERTYYYGNTKSREQLAVVLLIAAAEDPSLISAMSATVFFNSDNKADPIEYLIDSIAQSLIMPKPNEGIFRLGLRLEIDKNEY